MAVTEPSGLVRSWNPDTENFAAGMDENLRLLGRVLTQLAVLTMDTADPATLTPQNGDRHIVPAGAAAPWDTHADAVAYWDASLTTPAWQYYTPKNGWLAYVVGIGLYAYDSGWSRAGGSVVLPIGDGVPLLANAADSTKLARFVLSSIAANTQVDLTLPGASGTLARLADIPTGVGSSDLANDPTTTTGLNLGYLAGTLRSSTALIEVAAGQVSLTASATNYVEVSAAGVVSANTTGWTAGRIPLEKAVTDANSITSQTDERAWLVIAGDMQSDGSVAMTGDLDLGGHQIKNYSERTATVNATTATTTLDLSAARNFKVNMQANTKLAFSNVPASGVTSVTLDFVQDATGSRVLTLPTGTRTPGGSGITLSTAASAIDRVVMDNGNGAWNAFLAGGGMA